MTTEVRERRDEDADALVEILGRVHERDGYPVRQVNVRWAWLVERVDAAWTAIWDCTAFSAPTPEKAVQSQFRARPVGHVGVEEPAVDSLLPTGTLEVTRFFVDPDVRGSGAAGLLLDAAEAHAASAGRPLGLEVVEGSDAAIAFYVRRGWRPAGRRTATWAGEDGVHPTLLGYLA